MNIIRIEILCVAAFLMLAGGCKQSTDNPPTPRSEASSSSQQAAAGAAPGSTLALNDLSATDRRANGLTPEETLARAPTAAGTPAGTTTAAGTGGPVSGSDRSFVSQAASAGMAEVEAGRIVAGKTTDPDLKAFAQRMDQDHTKANDELMRLANTKGITVPTAVEKAERVKLERLKSLSGPRLRQIYLAQFGPGAHQKVIQLFERQSREGQDADLKAYADRTLPTLQEHLRMAQQLLQASSQ